MLSVRLTYYYAPDDKKRWIFGGQFSIEDRPNIVENILRNTLAQTHWFIHPHPESERKRGS
jgi:hypothetical protein